MADMFGSNPERGIYRTTDGGETWEHILYRGETTGAVDLTIDRRNPDVIIASLNHHVTYPWDEESGGVTTAACSGPRTAGTVGRTSPATPACRRG